MNMWKEVSAVISPDNIPFQSATGAEEVSPDKLPFQSAAGAEELSENGGAESSAVQNGGCIMTQLFPLLMIMMMSMFLLFV